MAGHRPAILQWWTSQLMLPLMRFRWQTSNRILNYKRMQLSLALEQQL